VGLSWIELNEARLCEHFICYFLIHVELFTGHTISGKVISVHVSVLVHGKQVLLAKEYLSQSLKEARVLFAFVCILSFAEEWH